MHTSAINFASPSSAALNTELPLTLLGPSSAMSQLWAQVRRLAPHVRTVLLTGSADCGQEAVARLLLDLSTQSHRPFVIVPSGTAEDQLSHLHGHGALPHDAFIFFPDADQLSAGAQAALLRLFRARRLGHFSVIASTAEDLRPLVSMGRFSAELADILSTVRIAVPSLKDRPEDLPMLLMQTVHLRCQQRQQAAPQLSDALLRSAMEHVWPGNLSEFSAVVDAMLSQAQHPCLLGPEQLREALASEPDARRSSGPVRMISLDSVVREHICAVLRGCRGNKLRAAEVLGISRSTLYRMLETPAQAAPVSLAN